MNFSIVKDGIHHRFQAPLFIGLLCKLGFHGWNYWHMSPSFIAMMPRQANVCRDCINCGWREMTDDGRRWQGRV